MCRAQRLGVRRTHKPALLNLCQRQATELPVLVRIACASRSVLAELSGGTGTGPQVFDGVGWLRDSLAREQTSWRHRSNNRESRGFVPKEFDSARHLSFQQDLLEHEKVLALEYAPDIRRQRLVQLRLCVCELGSASLPVIQQCTCWPPQLGFWGVSQGGHDTPPHTLACSRSSCDGRDWRSRRPVKSSPSCCGASVQCRNTCPYPHLDSMPQVALACNTWMVVPNCCHFPLGLQHAAALRRVLELLPHHAPVKQSCLSLLSDFPPQVTTQEQTQTTRTRTAERQLLLTCTGFLRRRARSTGVRKRARRNESSAHRFGQSNEVHSDRVVQIAWQLERVASALRLRCSSKRFMKKGLVAPKAQTFHQERS